MKKLVERYGIHGAAAGIVALIGFLVDGFLAEKISIPKNWFLVILCLLAYVFCIAIYEFRLLQSSSGFISPKLLRVSQNDDKSILFVFSTSPWLSYGLAYTIFAISQDVEYPLCVGSVINIQANGMIQIQSYYVVETAKSQEQLLQLSSGGSDNFGRVIVKPGVIGNG